MKNNNLSVLPFYPALDYQNARKWWVYGRIYPLYCPLGAVIPFQILMPHIPAAAEILAHQIHDAINSDGTITHYGHSVTKIIKVSATGMGGKLYLYNVPYISGRVIAAAYGSDDSCLGTFNPITSGEYSGEWTLPASTSYVWVTVRRDAYDTEGVVGSTTSIGDFDTRKLYTKDGVFVADFPDAFVISIIRRGDYDIAVMNDESVAFSGFGEGQYYIYLERAGMPYYSDVFTWVNNMTPFLKLTWWDDEDFVMPQGIIIYGEPAFKNVLYLQAEIAKPDYTYSEEGEERDGVFYPTKQISSKKYKFNFLAPEYLLDVLRFVRLSDYVEIENAGITYNVDSFLLSPEWEKEGDLAGVSVEFETDTIAKKIGIGYIKSL